MYFIHCRFSWQIVDVGSHIIIHIIIHTSVTPVFAVLASEADPQSVEFEVQMRAETDGSETSRVLEDFRHWNQTPPVNSRAGTDILCHMGLAFPIKTDVFRFSALIQDNKPEHVWMKPQVTGNCVHLTQYY